MMMKKVFIKSVLSVMFLIGTLSCEDLLEAEVKSEISNLNFWQNEGDFEPYLIAIYAKSRVMMADWAIRAGEERGEFWEEGYNSRFLFWDQNLTPGITYDWTFLYGIIGDCNLLLEEIELFEFSNTGLRDKVKAETLALRANTYFFLSKVWGDVPIVLEAVKDENTPLYPRSPVSEVFTQINADINKALSLIPEDGYTDKYRLTRPAMYALLADVKMWSGKVLGGGESDYRAAIAAIEQVQASGVMLLGDYGSIFDIDTNDEIIWGIACDRYEYFSPRYNDAFLRFDTGGSAENANEIPIRLAAQQAYAVGPRLLELFEDEPDDIRIARTYIPELYDGVPRKYWANKFRGTLYSDERTPDSDVVAYRLSGMLLLKAEAHAALNELAEARNELNKVRSRANVPDITEANQSALELIILEERGREMFHEGKRWFDLVRAHSSDVIDVYQFVPNLVGSTTPLYWPVATNVLIKNELLTDPDYQ